MAVYRTNRAVAKFILFIEIGNEILTSTVSDHLREIHKVCDGAVL